MPLNAHRWRSLSLNLALALVLTQGLLASALAASVAPARLLTVCPHGCQYDSISAALAAANAGDSIDVGAGAYFEHINLKPGVSIRGRGNNATVVSGSDQDTVVRASGGAIGRDTVLEGVTIIGGRAFTGGGIEIRGGASPTIHNNLITQNTSAPEQSYGGGIFISGGSPIDLRQRVSQEQLRLGGRRYCRMG